MMSATVGEAASAAALVLSASSLFWGAGRAEEMTCSATGVGSCTIHPQMPNHFCVYIIREGKVVKGCSIEDGAFYDQVADGKCFKEGDTVDQATEAVTTDEELCYCKSADCCNDKIGSAKKGEGENCGGGGGGGNKVGGGGGTDASSSVITLKASAKMSMAGVLLTALRLAATL